MPATQVRPIAAASRPFKYKLANLIIDANTAAEPKRRKQVKSNHLVVKPKNY